MNYKPFRNEETRSSVLSAAKGGSEAAWVRFFDLYAGYVFGLAQRAGLPDADSDEIVQKVFAELAAPGGFSGYDRGKGSFRAWLRQRVLWRIADGFRKMESESAVASAPTDFFDKFASPSDSSGDEAWMSAVRDEALRRLRAESSEMHFAVFQASVLEEIPTAEVISLYGISRGNLYQIRKRMTAAFRGHLSAALADLDSPIPPQ